MASPSKQTTLIRKRKKAKKGHRRKALLKNQGTTPPVAKLFEDEQ